VIQFSNVIGYDLINEPFLSSDYMSCIEDFYKYADPAQLMSYYYSMRQAIREYDKITPIIVEPPFWGKFKSIKPA